MAQRTETVKVQAEIEGYRRAMRDLDRSTAAAATAIDRHGNKITGTGARIVRSAEVNREAWTTAGTSLTAFGAVGVAALGLSAKAAIDWESAWTGVLKTVDGTPEQLAVLEDSLRDMATRLPASATEIAAVAEAAGQLGVKTDDIASFTETMINLGETTNLSADEAATAIARFSNIMGTAVSDADRLGSVIVDLGNNSATTEAEIVEFGLRLAAAGKQAGLSEGEILAFGSTLSSLGVNAEAGGTAMSKVFYSISDAVLDGGEKLETYAEIAGMSAEEFRKAYQEDAAGAIATFTAGLGDITEEGGSTTAVLEELELTDQRLRASLSATAAAGGLLTDSLALQSEAWEANTALVEEAEKRYDTTEAKLQIARNSINEAAIVIGENLLPVLADLASGVAGAADAFASMPDGLQDTIVGVGGATSAVALLSGGFLLMLPRILETRTALQKVTSSTGKFGTTMRGLTRGGGILAAATIGFAALNEGLKALPSAGDKSTTSVSELTAALLDMEEAGSALEGAFGFTDDLFGLTGGVDDMTSAARRLTDPSLLDRMSDFNGSIRDLVTGGNGADTSGDRTKDEINAIGESLASLVASGEAGRAERQFEMLAAQWEAGGGTVEELRDLMPAYAESLANVDNEQRLAADSAGETATEWTGLDEAATEVVQTLEEVIGTYRELSGETVAVDEAMIGFQQSLDDATVALEENGETLDFNTDAGRRNRESLIGIRDSAFDLIESLAATDASQEELTEAMAQGREAFIKTAEQMGLTREKADALADSYGLIPEEVATSIKLTGYNGTYSSLREIQAQLREITGDHTVRIGMGRSGSGGTTAYATGGAVYGPGTSTSDSIPAWLSDGEYVQQASAHNFWGTQAMDAMNSRDVSGLWSALAARGFAGGGAATYTVAAPVVNVTAPAAGGDVWNITEQPSAHAVAMEVARMQKLKGV